jgi:hypothetical protein
MAYVIIDFDGDSYHTGPLPLTPKTKLIWMGCALSTWSRSLLVSRALRLLILLLRVLLVVVAASDRYSDSGKCFYLEKSGHLSMLRRTRTNQLEPLLVANLKDEVRRTRRVRLSIVLD